MKLQKIPRSDPQIAKITAPKKRVQLGDASQPGLRLLLLPSGAKSWRVRIERDGKQRVQTLGAFPAMGVAEARSKAAAVLDAAKAGRSLRTDPVTFKAAAESYLAHAKLTGSSADTARRAFEYSKSLHPLRVDRVIGADVFKALREADARGAETVRKLKYFCSKVCAHAVAMGWAERNVVSSLPRIKATPTEGRPAITEPKEVGRLIRAIDGYEGMEVVCCALRILARTFVRPGELRQARWGEINFDEALWVVPADRMKGGREHVVPLSTQVVVMLWELHLLTHYGADTLLFPGVGSNGRAISENTLNAALRRLGYDTTKVHCAHGFRKTASTLLNGARQDSEAIEWQLAHVDRDRMRGVYNKNTLLEVRVPLMQYYSDALDKLKQADVALPSADFELWPEWLAD
jgi:integrase